MNHAAIVAHESEAAYRQRGYVLHLLDDRHFTALNTTPVCRADDGRLYESAPAACVFLNGYCLDAPDYLPGGCMVAAEENGRRRPQGARERGAQWALRRGETLRERRALAELIDNLLADAHK